MITSHILILSLFGCILSANAAAWGDIWPNNNAQETTIEDIDDIMRPVKQNIKIKDLDDKQKKLFLNSKPKMLEKTKILKRVRKLKDQGEERTKIIYRTRIIGLVDPKSSTDFNYFNLGDNIFEWPLNSQEDEDYSDIVSTPKGKSEVSDKRKIELKDIDTIKSPHNEMPENKHSSKKELRNNLITVKSVEDVNSLRQNKMNNLETIELTDTNYKQPQNTFRKSNFDTVEEFDTVPKQPINSFKKVHFVDSLEIYRQQQNEKQKQQQTQTNNEPKTNQRPLLQRQNAFYRHPPILKNTNYENKEMKIDNISNKPLFQIKPSDPVIVLPSRNNMNSDINIKEPNNQLNTPTSDRSSIVRQPSDNVVNTVRPDWIGNLLIKKVAQAQQAQVEAAARQMQEAIQQNKQQQQQNAAAA